MKWYQRLALAMLLSGSVGAGPALASVYVSGTLVADQSQAPAASVTLALYREGDNETPVDVVQSLANGSFVLRAPEKGQYHLTATATSYLPLDQALNIPKTGLSGQVLRVQARPSLNLRLLGPDGNPLLAGPIQVWVTVPGMVRPRGAFRRGAMPWRWGGMTPDQSVGEGGMVSMPLPGGLADRPELETVVMVRRAGVGCATVRLDHLPRDPITLRLETGSRLIGLVLDPDGKPLPAIPVMVAPLPGGRFGRGRPGGVPALTGANGTFQVDNLPRGEYVVLTRSPDGPPVTQQVVLEDSTTTITLRPE